MSYAKLRPTVVQAAACFGNSKNEKYRDLLYSPFLCGLMSVQFKIGTWVKVDYQAVLVVPIFSHFDKGKVVFLSF